MPTTAPVKTHSLLPGTRQRPPETGFTDGSDSHLRSPVYVYRPETMIDFPGRLAATFFTTGCNFRCPYCHNFAQLASRRPGYTWAKLDEIARGLRERWVVGAVISGGEPTLHENLPKLIEVFRRHGFAVKLDTNGSHPELLEELLPRLAYVAMDIKCGLAAYSEQVAYPYRERIRLSVEVLKTAGVPYEFRTTVVPSLHTDEEMHRIAELIEGAERYVLQPFIPQPDLPDASLRTQPRTTPQAMRRAAAIVAPRVRELQVRGG